MWIGTEPGFDRERYREGWRKVLRGEWGAAFLAVDGEDERHRGRGIGGALLQRGIEWARLQHLPDVSLLVFAHNERAFALYRKTGFEQREYYPKDVVRQTGEVWDTILMTKRLS